MEREHKLSFYFIIWTAFNSIRDKYIPPEGPHSWHWKVFATLFVSHLESLGLLWNTTFQSKHAFSLVETWISWHHTCPNLSGYSGLLTALLKRTTWTDEKNLTEFLVIKTNLSQFCLNCDPCSQICHIESLKLQTSRMPTFTECG